MDRRTKFILLIIGSIVLFALVIWLVVLPTLAPLFPRAAQPPALPTEGTPPIVQPAPSTEGTNTGPSPSGVSSFNPAANPDQQLILELSRRAGALSERVESGSSDDGFSNFDDAALDVSPTLAAQFRRMKEDLQKRYPATGPLYLVIARRLLESPQSSSLQGSTFRVAVQLQVQTQEAGNTVTAYREATVTFTKTGDSWVASGYEVKDFQP